MFRFQEKERVRREKSNERHLSKMRRLELRRLELEVAKQLKKPNEDMCLADHKVCTVCGKLFCLFYALYIHCATDAEDTLIKKQVSYLHLVAAGGMILNFDSTAPNYKVLRKILIKV